jgi:hypothetical protein
VIKKLETLTLVRTNVDLAEFRNWLEAKEYSKRYISATMSYAGRFSPLLKNGNLRELDALGSHKKASAVKALSLFSKFRGSYSFKALEKADTTWTLHFIFLNNIGHLQAVSFHFMSKFSWTS